MNDQPLLDTIRTDGTTFAACLDRGPLDRPVPGCPEWSLADLAAHLGFIHRNVARTVSGPADERMQWLPVPDPTGDLGPWIREGLDQLLDALTSRDGDEIVPTFVGPRPLRWWWRRQAHETSVHRWDAESAIGTPTPIGPELAVDGVDELLETFLARVEPERLGGDGATVHLHATDTAGEWVLQFDADAVRIERTHRKGDVAVKGSASDLLLYLYGRRAVADLEVFGDGTVLERWSDAINV
jgi:uncharacterized protein (TIGR03083 family)